LFTHQRAKPAKTPLEKQKIPTSINILRKQRTEIMTTRVTLVITLNIITATSLTMTTPLTAIIQIRPLIATAVTIPTR